MNSRRITKIMMIALALLLTGALCACMAIRNTIAQTPDIEEAQVQSVTVQEEPEKEEEKQEEQETPQNRRHRRIFPKYRPPGAAMLMSNIRGTGRAENA